MKIIFHSHRHDSQKDIHAYPEIANIGYVLKTPCDILFYQENGKTKVKLDPPYRDFVEERGETPGFPVPFGYNKNSFSWILNWGPELPKGYSAIYMNPMNKFDLPFLNTSGIIDNDSVSTPGKLPFFIKDGYTGTIKSGTPYLQIIPFKREDWESEYIINLRKYLRLATPNATI